MTKEFIGLVQALKNKKQAESKSGSETIIKSGQVKPVDRFRLVGKEAQLEQEPRIDPILEDGEVTGMKVTCVCGEVVEVFFDYDG